MSKLTLAAEPVRPQELSADSTVTCKSTKHPSERETFVSGVGTCSDISFNSLIDQQAVAVLYHTATF
jgi:hypothetical protein